MTRLLHLAGHEVMVPLIDLANHNNACTTSVEVKACPGRSLKTEACVWWTAGQDMEAGEEACRR